MSGDKKVVATSEELQNIIDSYEGPGPIKFAEELDKGGYSRDIQGVNIDLFNEKLKLDKSSFEGCDIYRSTFRCHDYLMNYDFFDFFKKTNSISHLTLYAKEQDKKVQTIMFISKNLFFNSENISNHKWLIETYGNMSAMNYGGYV